MPYETVNGLFTGIADSIRALDGTVDPIAHQDIPSKITALPAIVTASGDAVAADIALGKKAWVDGAELTGTLTTETLVDYGIVVLEYDEYFKPTIIDYYGSKIPLAMFRNYGSANAFISVLTANFFDTITDIGLSAFDTSSGPVHLIGLIDLSNSTNKNPFARGTRLQTVSFVNNSINESLSFLGTSVLSTASLLSIANGLDAGSAPKTLTMHATSKTNMDAINVDVVDGVAILGTTKTLTQFITTDKGWTIA